MVENAPEPSQITRMLREWSEGNTDVLNELFPIVYAELHRQADRIFRYNQAGHTLQATALIHEAYLKLIDRQIKWEGRTHFFAVAAQAMRQILVDHARTKHRQKRGGNDLKISLDDASGLAVKETGVDVVALDEALHKLERFEKQLVDVVELRYFGGLTLLETAEALGISRATAARDWETARVWLHHELTR